MQQNLNTLPGGLLQIEFILTPEETSRFNAKAATQLSTTRALPGFRPGNAPEVAVRAHFGDQAVAEEAALQAVRELYPKLVKTENLEVIGRPQIEFKTAEPLSFLIIVAQVPKVTLGAWDKIKLKRKAPQVEDSLIDEALSEIKEDRVQEALTDRPAKMNDRVEIDFDVYMDNVVIEGGSGQKYPLVLGKKQMVPGFEEAILGLKAGENKEFSITFPENYKANLAGKEAKVKAKVQAVYERTFPELNDEFAKNLGRFESLEDLKNKIKENIAMEHEAKEEQRIEREMLEEIVKLGNFTDLPEVLVQGEIKKMISELKMPLEERGLAWQDYLTSIKKSEADLTNDLKSQAEQRVKLGLLVRHLANEHSLEADDSAVDQEIEKTLESYGGDARVVAQLRSDDYQAYVKEVLTNRRVITWLKEKLVE